MAMKFLSQVLFSIGLFGFVLAGCERHDFEKTKVLHLGHGEGHGEHGDAAHAKADDHGKTDKDTAAEPPAATAPAATETPRATGL
jgi:hypothetical protein